MNWKNIVNIETLELEKSQGEEPYKYDYKRPATDMGAKRLGFNIATIPPRQFSCPYHLHHFEEELFLILDGRAILRQSGHYREVSKGDLIFFTTGPDGAHQLYNPTDMPCKILAISSKDDSEVCEYPDSKKIYVAKLKKIFQEETEVDYLRDERDPARHWPKEYVAGERST